MVIVSAIAQTVERSEFNHEVQRNADRRLAELQQPGTSVASGEARAQRQARARGLRPARIRARRLTVRHGNACIVGR